MKRRVKTLDNTQKEKKVEYLELIYDLIFVYIIGRNNSLLHLQEGGFITASATLAYVCCTLAVIQIWNYSTFYINLYGRNGVRDHVFLFGNMFLLYYMANGIGPAWKDTVYQYSAAWMCILINIAIQHLIETRNNRSDPAVRRQLYTTAAILFAQTVLIAVHTVVFRLTNVPIPYVPILFGILAMWLTGGRSAGCRVDFAHLTERAMLYIVFTFGEMIISIASYFSEGLTFDGVYFALMAFLIVVGLFLSYETLYNRIIDRERKTTGLGYMLLHVFLIFALNNISVALEFMREENVALIPKTLFLTGSFVLYYICMFLTMRFAKCRHAFGRHFLPFIILTGVTFICVMFLLRELMYANIAVTVVYIFSIWALMYRKGRNMPV